MCNASTESGVSKKAGPKSKHMGYKCSAGYVKAEFYTLLPINNLTSLATAFKVSWVYFEKWIKYLKLKKDDGNSRWWTKTR